MGLDFSNQVAVCCHWVPSLGPLHLDVLCLRCPLSVERKWHKSSSKSTHLCSKLFIPSKALFSGNLWFTSLNVKTPSVNSLCLLGWPQSLHVCSMLSLTPTIGAWTELWTSGRARSQDELCPCSSLPWLVPPPTSPPCPKKAEPETKAQVIPGDKIGGLVECNREKRQADTKEHFPVGHRCGQLEPVSLGPS